MDWIGAATLHPRAALVKPACRHRESMVRYDQVVWHWASQCHDGSHWFEYKGHQRTKLIHVDTLHHTTSHYITLPVNSQNVALDLVTWCDLRLHLIPQMFPRTAPFQGSHWDSRWLVRLELCGSLAMKFRAAMCMSIFLQYVYGVLVLSSFSSCVPSKRFR